MVRVVVQRVRAASVDVNGVTVGRIGRGLAILLGIGIEDGEPSVERIADKIASIRIFEDADGKMNLATSDVQGSMLVVSQFTLFANVTKGRRPSFISAGDPERARALYEHFYQRLEWHGYPVQTGQFGAHMLVHIENDGPVTLMLDTSDL